MSKRKLSITANNLYFNSKSNNQIVSPISSKIRDDVSNALDSLLALIRLLYSGQKNNPQEERMNLLKECLNVLKMISISPDNHKPITEKGLSNFYEKLIADNKEENFILCFNCLGILKNCTLTESISLMLLDSPILNKLIEELLDFYSNPDKLKANENMPKYFLYQNMILSNILKTQKGF